MAIALDKPLFHVAAEQHVNAMQHAMAEQPVNAVQRRGGNGIRARTCSCSARSAAIRINGDIRARSSAAQHCPEPHDTEGTD